MRGVGRAAEMEGVAAPRARVARATCSSARSVTRFARDAELRRRRVHRCVGDRLRCRTACRRRAGRGSCGRRRRCAFHAPVSENGGLSRRMHDGRASRNPAPLVDEPDRRQLTEYPPVSGRVPIDLLIMRSRGHHDLAFYAMGREPSVHRRRRSDRPGTDVTPIGIVELRPQLAAPPLQAIGRPALSRGRCRSWRRPSAASPPASSSGGTTRATGVLAGMAGAAGPRRHVAVAADFDGAVGAAGGPAEPRAGRGKSSKNGQEREIFGLAQRAGMGASFLPRCFTPDVTAEAVMTKLLLVTRGGLSQRRSAQHWRRPQRLRRPRKRRRRRSRSPRTSRPSCSAPVRAAIGRARWRRCRC